MDGEMPILDTGRQDNSRGKYTKHKILKISKILDTLKILGCLQTSTTKQIPEQYVPGCHRVIEHGNCSHVYFKPKVKQDNLAIIGKIAGGDKIEVIEDRENIGALWHIDLNPLLPEPLITIYVNNKPLIILADTGSEVNCVSYRLVEHLGLVGKIRDTKSKCCGPNGSPIETNGEI